MFLMENKIDRTRDLWGAVRLILDSSCVPVILSALASANHPMTPSPKDVRNHLAFLRFCPVAMCLFLSRCPPRTHTHTMFTY